MNMNINEGKNKKRNENVHKNVFETLDKIPQGFEKHMLTSCPNDLKEIIIRLLITDRFAEAKELFEQWKQTKVTSKN